MKFSTLGFAIASILLIASCSSGFTNSSFSSEPSTSHGMVTDDTCTKLDFNPEYSQRKQLPQPDSSSKPPPTEKDPGCILPGLE